ncbi:hypothetical protein BABINDRAFT_161547 [Babjeviella inositovora NRRL Y-12698]|uniref:Aldehyde dehydrogenase n=1 Tax=Babjeviella inositovora NRRL Y-12698 TaxID=984486 RepID=A0A1E3QQD5_9ASCO|nr:uncharacterized protein BABINDRAFT_161547 [Babjeviella inositovora NRRL Y-12698]ODQ79870.1 hypothetical protein BABINDRAFT_161547 [Babjeviella inositovora NRRL Y-12698]
MSIKSLDHDFSPYTPVEAVPQIVQETRDLFRANQKDLHTDSKRFLQQRLNKLRDLYYAINDHEDEIIAALKSDFNRSPAETLMMEVGFLKAEILYIIDNLHKWVRPKSNKDMPLLYKSASCSTTYAPLGSVLVIAPFNFPLLLSVSPLVGAIAAGNTVVLKPSELTPHFADVLINIIDRAFGSGAQALVRVVHGGIPETTAVLDQKFDKILYTGNPIVAKIVSRKAAEHLTPVILELGGKSPAIITENNTVADLKVIARRICWAKFSNSGQICVTVDYVAIHKSLHKEFVDILTQVLAEEFFPNLTAEDETFTHMIHDRGFDRLVKTITSSSGDVVFGGKRFEKESRFIEPTVIDNVDFNDSTMVEENFGPVLPIIEYDDLPTIVDKIVASHDEPLASYIFSQKNADVQYIMANLRSGGTVVNDTVLHVGLYTAPFGGVGGSGHGSYHGYRSFVAFSHERTTMRHGLWADALWGSRYPKNSGNVWQRKLFDATLVWKPWFGRTGNVSGMSWLYYIFGGLMGLFSTIYYAYKGKTTSKKLRI